MNICPHFDSCEAPLCPKQPSTVESGIWYPGEPVCSLRGVPHWVKVQRRLARVVGEGDGDRGFFSVRMLEALRRITPATRGADPDRPGAEENWLKARQTKPTPTAGEGRNRGFRPRRQGLTALKKGGNPTRGYLYKGHTADRPISQSVLPGFGSRR